MAKKNKPTKKEKEKKQKKPYGRRLGEGLRAVGDVGRETIVDPKGVPTRAHSAFRRWFKKVWDVRGGGLYACGFALSFLYFEISEFVTEDVGELAAMNNILSAELFGFIINFIVDTMLNTVKALMWPVYFVQLWPPYGAIGLGLAFYIFPKYLKKPIERWLTGDSDRTQISG